MPIEKKNISMYETTAPLSGYLRSRYFAYLDLSNLHSRPAAQGQWFMDPYMRLDSVKPCFHSYRKTYGKPCVDFNANDLFILFTGAQENGWD